MSSSIGFDRAADYYDETRGFPPGEEGNIAVLYCRAGNLTADSRVLEIGVGTGRIALPLAGHVRAVFGIDLSPAMLNRLRAKQRGEPIYITVGDATRLPFPSGSVDAVAAAHVFHLISDWPAALREVARVLTPGGVLLDGGNDSGLRNEADALLWDAWDAVAGSYTRRTVGVQREDIDSFLPNAGWRQMGDRLVHRYSIVHAPQIFLDRLERRVWSSLWSMPDEVIEQGIAAVRETMRQHGIDPQQVIQVETGFHVTAYKPPEDAAG
ncbi:MAG: class I SAM-dependent methyltransferase [Chloroflexi bacterium]|nr:MAG: class I SAM-dependent methyltransferase [Chloroflexota bacterium]